MLLPFLHRDLQEAGCDEAGRGCLAGSVFAAAVMLPKDFRCEDLNDSKQLGEKKRYILREIIEKEALAWGLGVVEASEIDQINVLNASFLAMHRAIANMNGQAEHLLIDGNRFRQINQLPLNRLPKTTLFDHYPEKPYTCIVKGDGKYLSIAAASILAKTYRDDYMLELDKQYPSYHWKSNKGYPTLDHRKGILEFGITEHHRKSFKLLETQLRLDF